MITRSSSEFGLLLQFGKHYGIPVGVNLYTSFAHSLAMTSTTFSNTWDQTVGSNHHDDPGKRCAAHGRIASSL